MNNQYREDDREAVPIQVFLQPKFLYSSNCHQGTFGVSFYSKAAADLKQLSVKYNLFPNNYATWNIHLQLFVLW